MCVLDDNLAPAEQSLVKPEHERLRDTRMYFQSAILGAFCEPGERITGRKVRAFPSSLDTEAGGQSVEMFVLHPEGYDGPPRTEAGRM